MRLFFGLLILLFVFVPAAFCGLMLAGSTWIAERGFYNDVLDNESLYSAFLETDLPSYLGQEVFASDQIPAAALATGLQQVITPAYLRDEALNVVDQVFDYLDGETNTLQASLNLAPIKARLIEDGGQEFAQALAGALPPCSAGQSGVASDGTLLRCLPSDMSVSDASQQISNSMPEWVAEIPDQIALNEPVDVRSEFALDTTVTRDLRGGILAAAGGIGVFALIFWLIGAMVGAGGARGRWILLGVSLLVPALTVLFLGLMFNSASGSWLQLDDSWRFQLEGRDYSREFRSAFEDTLANGFSRVGSNYMMIGAVASGVAVLLMVIGLITPSSGPRYREVNVPVDDDPFGKPKRGGWPDDDFDKPKRQ